MILLSPPVPVISNLFASKSKSLNKVAEPCVAVHFTPSTSADILPVNAGGVGVGGARDKEAFFGEGKGRDRSKSEGKSEKVGLPGSGLIGRSAFGAAASGAGMSADGACKGKDAQVERAKARDGGGGKVAEPPEQVRGS